MTMDATRLGNSIVDGMKTVSTFSTTQETASRANMIKLAQAVIDEIEDYYSGGGGGTPTFETVAKNLDARDATLARMTRFIAGHLPG